jgi:hypothetical protein
MYVSTGVEPQRRREKAWLQVADLVSTRLPLAR